MASRILYLAGDAAALARVNRITIANWHHRGQLAAFAETSNGWPLFTRDDLLAAMAHSKKPSVRRRLAELEIGKE